MLIYSYRGYNIGQRSFKSKNYVCFEYILKFEKKVNKVSTIHELDTLIDKINHFKRRVS